MGRALIKNRYFPYPSPKVVARGHRTLVNSAMRWGNWEIMVLSHVSLNSPSASKIGPLDTTNCLLGWRIRNRKD